MDRCGESKITISPLRVTCRHGGSQLGLKRGSRTCGVGVVVRGSVPLSKRGGAAEREGRQDGESNF